MDVPVQIRRLAALVSLLAFGALALGARCIENHSVYVDDEGYTHIVGEMYNDTDVQGTSIMLRGTLYDGAGNVIATKDAPICPPDTQPHSQSLFDIRFDNPGIPPHASYDVRPISGKTLTSPLPDPQVIIFHTDAVRLTGVPPIPGFPIQDGDVFFTFDLRNQSPQYYFGIQGCSAAYDNAGRVIVAEAMELIMFDENEGPVPAVLPNEFRVSAFLGLSDVPPQVAYVRAWLWFGPKDSPTSPYQFIMTPPITTQVQQFSASMLTPP